jgi:cytochrome b6-f complex iron-sulfur subunit
MPDQSLSLTRREFLYYVWGASLALFMAEAGGAALWFAYPRFKAGEFGGIITLGIDEVPPPQAAPKAYEAGRFWVVNVSEQAAADPRHPPEFATRPGVLALYKVCVHLGCLYQWKPTGDHFHCPCHGSKYLKDGTRVHRPANRNLDRFLIRALDAEGNVLAETKTGDANTDPSVGQPIPLPPGTVMLQVDTGKRIQGRRNNTPDTVS